MTPKESKRSVGASLLKQRLNMGRSEVSVKSGVIRKTLLSLPEYKNAKAVLFYVPFKNEVDTKEMIRDAFLKKKVVVVPVVDTKKKCLTLSEIKSLSELSPGAFGILEPKKEFMRKAPLGCIDLALIPGVAFDRSGTRIGFGNGFYDRLLENAKFAKAALAYNFQLVNNIPAEAHDAKVDMIITEDRIIRCNSGNSN